MARMSGRSRVVEVDAPRAAVRLPREIWVLVGASFMIAIGFGLVAPTLPVFVRSFDVGITAASLVVSIFALTRLVFAPGSGWLVSKLGELRVFMVGLVVVAVSSAGMAFAGEYWHLLALRGFGGIGSTMFTISALSMLIRLAPPAMRARASGAWATGFLMGNVIGPLVGGGLVAISLRAPFLIYAVVLVVVAGVSGLMLRGRPGGSEVLGVRTVPSVLFGQALTHPTYRAALVANFTIGWVAFGIRTAIVPLFVVEALGQDEVWAGVALAVFAAGNAVTLLFVGRLADRIGRRPPVIFGLAVSGVATAVIGFVHDPGLFLVVSAVAGLGGGLINPPINAAVGDVLGKNARGGTVIAGFQMAADIGLIAGPLVAGALAETAGYEMAFAVSGGITVFALVAWIRAPETLTRVSRPAADGRKS